MPPGTLGIPQTWVGHASPASATTTLTQQTQKPVTRRRDSASSACTTLKGTIVSCVASATMETLSGRTAEVRCACAWGRGLHTVIVLVHLLVQSHAVSPVSNREMRQRFFFFFLTYSFYGSKCIDGRWLRASREPEGNLSGFVILINANPWGVLMLLCPCPCQFGWY